MGPMLVINKMDRLITELEMTPSTAEHHIAQLITTINALISTFHSEEVMSMASQEGTFQLDEKRVWKFSPISGNVVFCSAIHRWGFRLQSIAKYYENRLGLKAKKIIPYLWGEYYYDAKNDK